MSKTKQKTEKPFIDGTAITKNSQPQKPYSISIIIIFTITFQTYHLKIIFNYYYVAIKHNL